jgi:histidinol dehydrogenase
VLNVLPYPSEEAEARLKQIAGRKIGADVDIERRVQEILEAVRREGDDALLRYTRQFDAPEITLSDLTVTEAEIEKSYAAVGEDFLDMVRAAAANIEAFHRHQLRSSYFTTCPDGTFLGQMVRPVASAGLYVPGGKGGETPLISSVLMNGLPARIAGVSDLALATPPRRDGSINPCLLVAAREVGIHRIHKMGSAWAIGALAFGTPGVGKVDVIVGPGNMYVAVAKKLVSGEVGIDMLAGPSEILVVADGTATPEYIAADLLSQAEHDSMASAVLITTDAALAERVDGALREQLLRLPRREIAAQALGSYGAAFVVGSLDEGIELANRLSPEHLELQVREPLTLLGKIRNAGAVFLGEFTPEAVGDYFAGPNHVLPTAGTARFSSALGVENFLKRTSVIAYSREAMRRDASSIVKLAELEGLEAHAASVRIRMERLGD